VSGLSFSSYRSLYIPHTMYHPIIYYIHSFTLHFITLYYITLCCIMLHYIALPVLYILYNSMEQSFLLEKLIVTQLVIPCILWNPKVRYVLIRANHWSISWARCIQSTPSHPISLISFLILSSHLRQGLPMASSHYVFRLKPCMHFSSLMRSTCLHILRSLTHHLVYISWSLHAMKFLIMQSSRKWKIKKKYRHL